MFQIPEGEVTTLWEGLEGSGKILGANYENVILGIYDETPEERGLLYISVYVNDSVCTSYRQLLHYMKHFLNFSCICMFE